MSWDLDPDTWLAEPAPAGVYTTPLDDFDAHVLSRLRAMPFGGEARRASNPEPEPARPAEPGEDRSSSTVSGEFIVPSLDDNPAAITGEFAAEEVSGEAATSSESREGATATSEPASAASGEFTIPGPEEGADALTAAHISGEFDATDLPGGAVVRPPPDVPDPPDVPVIAAAEDGESDAGSEVGGAGLETTRPEPLEIEVKVPSIPANDALQVEVRVPPPPGLTRDPPVPRVMGPVNVTSREPIPVDPVLRDPGSPAAVLTDTTGPVEAGESRLSPMLFIPPLTRPTEPEPEPEPEPETEEEEEEEELDSAQFEEALVDQGEDAPAESAVPPVAPPPPKPKQPPSRRRKHWCEDVFGDHFASLERSDSGVSADRDVEFIAGCLDLEAGASILDVGFGSGEHTVRLAARGYDVTGIDNSLAQVLRASEQLTGAEGEPSFMHGDMRELADDRGYDAVVCIGTTFGYFDEDQNRVVMEQLRDRLNPGGKMLIQVINRDHLVSRLPARSWWQGEGCLVLDEAEMNFFANRLRVHRTVVFEDGRQYEHYIFIRAFTLHDLGKLISSCGLRVLEISGSRDTRGKFYGATSPDIWIMAESRESEG